MIAAEDCVLVLLAAGRSQRMGDLGSKLDEPFLGRALGLHVAVALEDMPFRERVAVVGKAQCDYAAHGYTTVRNDDPALGLGRSVALGVDCARAHGAQAVVVALADMPRVTAVTTPIERPGGSAGNRRQSASFAVFGVFLLNLFLASQVVGTMAEERNNKVIEVLAAAVPLESVFLGKLLGMFGVAILFVCFWGTVIAKLGSLLPPEVASALAIQAAVGMPAFVALFVTYFTMAYLLLGSAFLVVGAQASTPREIQMLALPISVLQMGMLALALAGTARPDSWVATAAQLFPLSSPFAMAGRAATSPALWPHLAAIAWQLLWVTLFITLGARLFRRGVLQSGSAKPFWKRGRA